MSAYPSYYTPSNTSYSRPPLNGTLNPEKLSLRKHDAIALITCLLLLRLAFTPSQLSSNFGDSNIGASMELAFYSAFKSKSNDGNVHVASPVPIDIDGDGVVDALVVPAYANEKQVMAEKAVEMAPKSVARKDGSAETKKEDASKWGDGKWGLRVLNLKPLHGRDDEMKIDGPNGPFAPRTMFLSPLSDNPDSQPSTDVYPIKLLPIQIPIQRTKLGEEEKIRQRHKKTDPTAPTTTAGGYGTNSAIPPKDEYNKDYDRTRHYFCGRDWHHASSSCHRHCPGGLGSECGDGETCYADTPCDAMLPLDSTPSKETTEETDMALTVRGTLPGISTVWSDGSVSLHAITADVIVSDPKHEQHRGKRERQKKKKPELELRQLWRVFPLGTSSGSSVVVDFEELGLSFESGVIHGVSEHTTTDKDGKEIVEQNRIGSHGAILLGGRYSAPSISPKVSFHALDALTGEPLWELDGSRGWSSSSKRTKKAENQPTIPIIHTTSSARRRSHLPVKDTMDPDLDNENSFVEGDDVMTSEECMAHFRHSVLDEANGALPHEYWDGDHGSITIGRFERKKSPRKKTRVLNKKSQLDQKDALVGRGRDGSFSKTMGGSRQIHAIQRGSGGGSGNWQTDLLQRALARNQQKHTNQPTRGKPNVVMFHGRDGLAVLSLKNGRPVCHISLLDNALYADMDKDGVVDVIQVVTSPKSISRSGNIQNLIQRINKSQGGDGSSEEDNARNGPAFCHALVTSGLPPKEEIFTAPLCLGGTHMSADPKMSQVGLRAAAPLLVEGSLGYGNDVVFAINNGVIVRYDSNGREVWRKKSAKDGTPAWKQSGFLGRVQFGAIKSHSSVSASSHRNQHRPGSPVRPILISGEDGAAVISPTNGKVLSYVTYPQTAIAQPLLADFNGDGTDDLLVVSADAIWGYCVVVETGRSGFFSIVVVTLVVGVALSALIHKTSQTSKRSMDA